MARRRGEFELIAELFAPLAVGEPGALGLSDDAALLSVAPGRELVVTSDALVAGVHFLADDPADEIGRKVLRVNLSDLAAMGARARAYTLALIRGPEIDDAWLEAFAAGLAADGREFGVALIGGDTVATPGPSSFAVTAFGEVAAGRALRRAGARPGDDIWVSGTIGDAALGLALLKGDIEAPDPAPMIARYRRPEPRLALGQALASVASACIDVSDGLIADAGHIAAASGAALAIEAELVPHSEVARALVTAAPEIRGTLLTGGDDYELLLTAPEGARAAVLGAGSAAGVAMSRIGRVKAGAGVTVLDAEGNETSPERAGYTHF